MKLSWLCACALLCSVAGGLAPAGDACEGARLATADREAYEFLSSHDMAPRSVLVAGYGKEALHIACSLKQAELVVAVTAECRRGGVP